MSERPHADRPLFAIGLRLAAMLMLAATYALGKLLVGRDVALVEIVFYRQLFALPEATRLYLCHDYPTGAQTARHESSVGAQYRENIHVRHGTSREAYVELRTARDRTLAMPALIIPALQVNICAGVLPTPGANGIAYLRMPLNALDRA